MRKNRICAAFIRWKPKREYYYIKRFISGEFDADRADYLLRDSYLCGVKYGLYDYLRYVGSFKFIKDNNKDSGFNIGISSKNIHAIESFILARHYYNIQIPYHRTRVGYDIILRKFIEINKEKLFNISGINLDNNELNIDFDKFVYFDDYTIFEEIKKSDKEKNLYASILMRKDRLHPVFDREVTNENNEKIKSLLVKYIEELKNNGLSEEKDFFKYENKLSIHKIPGNPDEEKDGNKKYPIVDDDGRNEGSLIDYSPIFKNLANSPIYLYRVYVVSNHLDIAKKIYYNLIN